MQNEKSSTQKEECKEQKYRNVLGYSRLELNKVFFRATSSLFKCFLTHDLQVLAARHYSCTAVIGTLLRIYEFTIYLMLISKFRTEPFEVG